MPISYAIPALLVLAPFAFAQTANEPSGHWEGTLSVQGHELKVAVDLARDDKQAWKGAFAVPEMNLKGFALADISAEGGVVHFAMKGIPGDPAYQGKLSADGKTIAGEWRQSGSNTPLTLTRTGDAKFEPVAKSTPITKEFTGTWEGAINANGTRLRLVLKLTTQPDGIATGTLTSVDQGNAEIPVASIVQTGNNLKLGVPTVGGTYDGDINKEGTMIAGEWLQGPDPLPLVFKRPEQKQ